MNHELSNPISVIDLPSPAQRANAPRCQYRTPTGRRCRSGVSDHATGLCSKHARSRPAHLPQTDFSSLLVGQLTELTSAQDINQVLSRLLVVLAQDRISTRRAAVIAYISSLLLRSLPAIDHELNPTGEELPPEIIIDTPRPIRNPEPVVQRS